MAEDSASSEQPRALTSRRLAGNYSRGSVGQVSGSRVDAYACLTIIVGIRMTGISRPSATQMVKYGKERGGERERERERKKESVREEEAQGDYLREYACCRADIARRILTVVRFAHYYGTFAIRHGHISHPGAHFDLLPARHSRNVLRAAPPGDHFNYLTGSSISSVSTRDDPGIVIQVLTIL